MRILSCYNFETWKRKAKQMLNRNIHPKEILWQNVNEESQKELLVSWDEKTEGSSNKVYKVSRTLINLAEVVSYHKNDRKWEMLYSVLWRSLNGEPFLLDGESDPEVLKLILMRKQVLREIRKAKNSIKFKEGHNAQGSYFVAWYECEHHIVKKITPYLQRKYRHISWTLLTPTGGVRWDQKTLTYLDAPIQKEVRIDELESGKTPSKQLDTQAVLEELPIANWEKTAAEKSTYEKENFDLTVLKESYQNIWKSYGRRKKTSSLPFVCETQPKNIKSSINNCDRCELNCAKSSPFIGEGHQQPDILFVAEKPEKNKHAAIRQLIHKIFQTHKAEENSFHLTYAIKNETLESSKIPAIMNSCRPWLENEISILRPKIVVCLGEKAAWAVLGRDATPTDSNGMTVVANHHFEMMVVEDCFSYMSHPKFREKFQKLSGQIQNKLFKSCAA